MEREKLYKALLEDEGFKGSSLSILNNHIYSAHPNVIINFISRDPVDFRLGSEISECFDENEELSDHGSEVKYFAKVTSDEYIIPNARQVKYFSSKFKLMDEFQGLYSVKNVDLYGSQLITTTPPSITCLSLESYSKAVINLKERSRYGGVELSEISLKGTETELNLEAEVEDKVKDGEFYLRITGENSRAELDLRKLKIDKLEVFFNHSGPNHYIHLKVSPDTIVNFGFWNGDPKGVKVILEGGSSINASELINSGVDYE
jgi:hypothetical protein|nr:MAG TPA: hypothetical protein [Caudoviricetes sp.]